GADVIHVESIRRPDGVRMTGAMVAGPDSAWWEYSNLFLSQNTNKRGITLDLRDPRGVALCERLVARSEAVAENYSPRVLEQFGLGWETIRGVNPRTTLMRMPAFGLVGPWRDHVGFAQTMEQLTGLAWITGHPADQPRIPRGPCDPLAGMHAAFALLIALAERDVTGRGAHVEVPMVEVALNVAAESLIEFSAYGRLLERQGNRSPSAAPQGLYRCRDGRTGYESWLALSGGTDAQGAAPVGGLRRPAWGGGPGVAARAGRRRGHDRDDRAVS